MKNDKFIFCFVCAFIFISAAAIPAAGSAGTAGLAPGRYTTERVANSYVGSRDYLDVLNNIDFSDVGASWARDAIYEGGALGVIKGFGSSAYGGNSVMTKEQAIAVAIRAAGLENAAQADGEAIEAANRSAGFGPSDSETVWMNGCLKIAADRGLIDQNDFKAAMGDPAGLALSGFRRGAAAERQDFAYWLTRILDVKPVRGQQALFTFYSDWKSVDSLYAPYIEAAISEKIMGGVSPGRLSPRDGVTREQAAQMVKNASKYVYKANQFTESTGTIVRITEDVTASAEDANVDVVRTIYFIRNQIGSLDTITTQIAVGGGAGAAARGRLETGLVAVRDGRPEDETALNKGDRIRYITSKNRAPGMPDEVRFVELLKSNPDKAYILAQIDGIDAVNRKMALTPIMPVEYPIIGEIRRAADQSVDLAYSPAEFFYEDGVTVKRDGAYAAVGDLAAGMVAIVGVENYKNLFYIETSGYGVHLGEAGIARGIIEESNPVLGYVSMYVEAGDLAGARPLGKDSERPELYIYSYVNVNGIDVRKDGAKADMNAVSAGDSAFIRVDAAGGLTAISAVTNYRQVYGAIASMAGGFLFVRPEGEPGVIRNYKLDEDALIIKDYRLVDKSSLAPGSSVRLLLRETGGTASVREVTLMREGDRGSVSGIYKAVLERFDETSQKAVIYNVQKLVRGKWEKADRKGFGSVLINPETRIYLNDGIVTAAAANKLLRGNEAYIAVRGGYGGVEIAAQICVRGAHDKEQVYNDVVRAVRKPSGGFDLLKGPSDITAGDRAIVVKDGKLVGGAEISRDDLVYVVASRESSSGRMIAEIVDIGDRVTGKKARIYRGRISKITQDKEFTLESFSELDPDGAEWKYANTPKTFAITFETLFLTAEGVTSIRKFGGRGEYDYANPPQTVYVLSDGTDALAISTAPYGIENYRGAIRGVGGQTFDEDGKAVTEPTEYSVENVTYYDRSSYAWVKQKSGLTATLAPNTLIIKNGAPAAASALKKGDAIRVIRAGGIAAGGGAAGNGTAGSGTTGGGTTGSGTAGSGTAGSGAASSGAASVAVASGVCSIIIAED